ncbi:MAG: hypothetical protein M0R30_00345 [Methanoregula sp.]|uniref:hypothetical protein n=1 Tax=Methanoregula sp. TaxID=2052170 RepID=UPI0025D6D543|nr:hypothetical protein [Methanoregula sp.]MCK9630069.1 hypothetical protein [Methanoregula sp.]
MALAVAAAAAFLLTRTRRKKSGPGTENTPAHPRQNLGYKPDAKPISPIIKKAVPHPARKPAVLPQPKTTTVVEEMTDISGSLRALVDKYSLDQFTIATSDGLVFASSGGESAQEDAAHYGGQYGTDPDAVTPGVTLFGFTHKGSDLIGIIRTNLRIPADVRRMIEQDTQDILNWWI